MTCLSAINNGTIHGMEENDVMYVVLELLMGGDLLERILIKHDCNAHYTEFDAQQIMHQILLSLEYLHNERKIVVIIVKIISIRSILF